MAHQFMSEEWFEAVEALRAEAPEPPPEAADMAINVTVTDTPNGTQDAHLKAGFFGRGHADGVETTITAPYDVIKGMLVDMDPQAAMQAFMAGKIQVDGDMTKLMSLASSMAPTPEQMAMAQKLKELTAI